MLPKDQKFLVVGLMSGTSLDGVDAALLETDGYGFVRPFGFVFQPYDDATRAAMRACLGRTNSNSEDIRAAADSITRVHIDCVHRLLIQENVSPADIFAIGFHGQTIFHDPAQGKTVQIGNPQMLVDAFSVDVVFDFRSADVAAGGQGAPFLPLYHRARVMSDDLPLPIAVLNLGGVGNMTWINGTADHEILAFDTGPANALIDDFVLARTGKRYDENGALARAGVIDHDRLAGWLNHPFFAAPAPKSLDRDAWHDVRVDDLSLADGAATLAAFTVQSVVQGFALLPERPREVLITGGGRHNQFMMQSLQEALAIPVRPVEEFGWNGDAMEAEGFAYLAVRSILGEPLSLPCTTGTPHPITGGVLFRAHKAV